MIRNVQMMEETKPSPYRKLRNVMRKKLETYYEKMKNGDLRKSIRRTFCNSNKQTKLYVNCPGWMLAVLYDDLPLFQKATEQEVYLNPNRSGCLFTYRDQSHANPQNWINCFLSYDLVWYCISRNHHVTEEVLLKRLEEYAAEESTLKKRGALREILSLVNSYLDGTELESKRDHRKQKKKANLVLKNAPGIAEKLTENLVSYRNLGIGFELIAFSSDVSMTQLFLWAKLLDEEHSFEWYCSYFGYVLNLHFEKTGVWFLDTKDMMQSLQNLISLLWKVRKKIGSRFLELLLSRWEGLQQLREKSKSMNREFTFPLGSFGGEKEKMVIPDEIWKAADSVFQKMIIAFCREYPESIADMVQRRKYFPSVRALRFLSREICHGPVPVTIKYLGKRSFCFDSALWNPGYDPKKEEEDATLFRWIVVQKKGKRFTKLEQHFLHLASEDILREAGKAGLFSQNCMQQYIDYSRRFGRMEIIPVLIRMREQRKEESHESDR